MFPQQFPMQDSLRDAFLAIVNGASASRIRTLIVAQENFARDMRAVVRRRDIGVNRMRQE